MKAYFYEDDAAPLLPADTVIRVMAWYNNSATNKNVVDREDRRVVPEIRS